MGCLHPFFLLICLFLGCISSCAGCMGGGWGGGGFWHHEEHHHRYRTAQPVDPFAPGVKATQALPVALPPADKIEPQPEDRPMGSKSKVPVHFASSQYEAPKADAGAETVAPVVTIEDELKAVPQTKIEPKPAKAFSDPVKELKKKIAAQPKKASGSRCFPQCICEAGCCCNYPAECIFRWYADSGYPAVDKLTVEGTVYRRPSGQSIIWHPNGSGWFSAAWEDHTPQVFAQSPQRMTCSNGVCHLEDSPAMKAGACAQGSCSGGVCGSGSCAQGRCSGGSCGSGVFRSWRGCRGCR